MGSPKDPLVANIFMGFYKSKWSNNYNLNNPKFYLRYVDDILAAFGKEQNSLKFLNYLSNKHTKIKFTIEKKLTLSSLSLIYLHQISIIKISHFKHITN